MARKLTAQESARRFSIRRRQKLRREIDMTELWGQKVFLGPISSVDALEIQESFNGKDPEKFSQSEHLKFGLKAASRLMETEAGESWYANPDKGFEELLHEDSEVQTTIITAMMEYLGEVQDRQATKKNSKKAAPSDSDSSSPKS